MKLLLKNIRESCNKEEKQEEDNLKYKNLVFTNFLFIWFRKKDIPIIKVF